MSRAHHGFPKNTQSAQATTPHAQQDSMSKRARCDVSTPITIKKKQYVVIDDEADAPGGDVTEPLVVIASLTNNNAPLLPLV